MNAKLIEWIVIANTQSIVPPEAEQEGSIHSRYSCRSSTGTRHEREFEVIHMEREASPSQSSVSARKSNVVHVVYSVFLGVFHIFFFAGTS